MRLTAAPRMSVVSGVPAVPSGKVQMEEDAERNETADIDEVNGSDLI